MNIRGIELLRAMRLPGPLVETISTDLTKVDLNRLYDGSKRGATIVAMDYTEPVVQNPLLEKNARKYRIERGEYFDVWTQLIQKLEGEGVDRKDMGFLTHQTYTPDDISFSGRVASSKDPWGFGRVLVEAVKSLRKGKRDFQPQFIYRCPIVGDQIRRSEAEIMKERITLDPQLVKKLVRDVSRIPGNAHVDFEVYADTGRLFYHDMFIEGPWS
jgi:hypothetical protein